MASNSQDISFGDFSALSAEERTRIQHILYGPRKTGTNAPEFPWDGSSDSSAPGPAIVADCSETSTNVEKTSVSDSGKSTTEMLPVVMPSGGGMIQPGAGVPSGVSCSSMPPGFGAQHSNLSMYNAGFDRGLSFMPIGPPPRFDLQSSEGSLVFQGNMQVDSVQAYPHSSVQSYSAAQTYTVSSRQTNNIPPFAPNLASNGMVAPHTMGLGPRPSVPYVATAGHSNIMPPYSTISGQSGHIGPYHSASMNVPVQTANLAPRRRVPAFPAGYSAGSHQQSSIPSARFDSFRQPSPVQTEARTAQMDTDKSSSRLLTPAQDRPRRNKKKRPAGYYDRLKESAEMAGLQSGVAVQALGSEDENRPQLVSSTKTEDGGESTPLPVPAAPVPSSVSDHWLPNQTVISKTSSVYVELKSDAMRDSIVQTQTAVHNITLSSPASQESDTQQSESVGLDTHGETAGKAFSNQTENSNWASPGISGPLPAEGEPGPQVGDPPPTLDQPPMCQDRSTSHPGISSGAMETPQQMNTEAVKGAMLQATQHISPEEALASQPAVQDSISASATGIVNNTGPPPGANVQVQVHQDTTAAPKEAVEASSDLQTSSVEDKQAVEATPETDEQKLDTQVPVSQSAPAMAPEKPKVSSWAGLFKGTPSAAASTVIYSSPPREEKKESSGITERVKDKVPTEGPPQQPVPPAEDAAAKQLAEILLKHEINYTPLSLQPRGLVNRGNWCYVNATLQALLACPPLYHLAKALPTFPALTRGPTSTPVIDSIVEFVNEFTPMQIKPAAKAGPVKNQDLRPGPQFEPTYVYKMLQVIKYDAAFKHGRQEDAEEFLGCLLNCLHDEMLAATNLLNEDKPAGRENKEQVANGELADESGFNGEAEETGQEEDDDQWEQVGPKNKSVITRSVEVLNIAGSTKDRPTQQDTAFELQRIKANFAKSPISAIFRGQIRSALHQPGSKESATLQPFFTLQLDIQPDKVWTLKDALEGLVSKESIQGYTCTKTKVEVEATRRITLEELPPVLIMHFKCFVYDKSGGCQKVVKKVEFDVDLKISKDLMSPSAKSKYRPDQRNYKLFAVVNHHGPKAIGGHYTTDVYHPGLRTWLHTDDGHIKTISAQQVLKFTPPKVPYLLYYQRADLLQSQ